MWLHSIWLYYLFYFISFYQIFDELVPNCFRVVNHKDSVPKVPSSHWFNIFMQYDHVGRPLPVNAEPIKGKQHPITALLLGLKGSEFLEGLKDSDVIARHQMQAYYTASCRNAGRTKALYEYVGLWSSSLILFSHPSFSSLFSSPSLSFIHFHDFHLQFLFLIITPSSLSLLHSSILIFVTLSFFVNAPSFFYLALSRSIISFPFFAFFLFSFTFLRLYRQFEDRHLPVHPIIQSFIDAFSHTHLASRYVRHTIHQSINQSINQSYRIEWIDNSIS